MKEWQRFFSLFAIRVVAYFDLYWKLLFDSVFFCREQAQLKKLLVVEDSPEITKIMSSSNHENPSESFFIGGVDISFVKGDNLNACAALIVVDFPELKVGSFSEYWKISNEIYTISCCSYFFFD